MSEAPRYELRELLGEGGMGRVFSAVHWPTGVRVAVKTLRPEASHEAYRRRLLLDEATAAARIRDAHVVRLFDVGATADGAPFLVLELVVGHDLELFLREWPGWAALSSALTQTLAGLSAAHAAGIVHRDLKPGNVLVESGTGAVRLLDFGVAEMIDPLHAQKDRLVAGTPEFMAPEQLLGDRSIGPWSDLYAFGVLLCHAIYGTSPFHDEGDLATLLERKRAPGDFRDVPPREGLTVPDELADLVTRLLDPHPRRRPRFASEVEATLRRLAPQVVDHVPLGTIPRESRPELSFGPPTTVDPAHSPTGLVAFPEAGAAGPAPEIGHSLPAVLDPRLSVAPVRLGDPPFLGRERERAALLADARAASETGVPRIVVCIGDAGVGKSALARFCLGEVERHGAMDGIAGGYDRVGADLAAGLRHALLRLFPASDDDREEALGWLTDHEPSLDVPLLARFLRGAVLTETLAQARVVVLAATALVAASRARPVLLWLDDLLFSTDGGLEVVTQLAREGRGRILVVATVRTPEDPAVEDRLRALLALPGARAERLGLLTDAERRALLAAIVPLREPTLSLLAARVPASPLYVRGTVQRWLEAGLLSMQDGGWDLSAGVSEDDVSATRSLGHMVDDLLAAFFGELGPRAAAAEGILHRAALLGHRFDELALRATVADRKELRGEIDAVLERALFRGICRADGAHVFSFDHGMVHEALLGRAERSPERQRLLLDTANGLQARYGKDRADVAASVAKLLRRARTKERAWERLLSAIELAAWAADEPGALSHLALAREWLLEDGAPPSAIERAHVDYAEARVAYYGLRYQDAELALARALQVARARADEAMIARGEAFSAELAFYQDRFAECHAKATHMLAIGKDSEDPDILVAAAGAAARLADLLGLHDRHDEELAMRAEVLRLLRAGAAPGWRERIALLNLAEIEVVTGRLREAEAHVAECRRSAQAAHDAEIADAAKETLAHFLVGVGDPAEARVLLAGRIERIEKSADRWRRTGVRVLAARLALSLDPLETTMAATEAALAAFAEVPHDESWTRHAMREVAAGLEARGATELAGRVRAALSTRDAAIARGFVSTSVP